METHELQVPKGPFKFLYFASQPYKVPAILAVASVVLGALTGTLTPYLYKRIIDTINGVPGFGSESVWFWTFTFILFGLINGLSWRASGFAGMRWATGVRATSRDYLSEHVVRHGYKFFSNRFAGAIGAKLRTATEGLKSLTEDLLWSWIGFFLRLAISFAFIFSTSASIGLIFVSWLVIVIPVNIVMAKKKVPHSIAAQESDTKLTAQTVDVLTNINAMHDYARMGFELKRLRELIGERRRTGMKNWHFNEIILTVNTILEAIFVGGMIAATVYLWDLGRVTAGDIVLILTLMMTIRNELAHIGQRFNNFTETISQIKEGLADILHDHEIKDAPGAKRLKALHGEIIFKDLSFQYESQQIFKKLNLQIKSGERVGLIGRSGAGKSTLMKLLMRQYDVTSGEIYVDGQNIAEVRQESLRETIAVVPQEPLLFHRSLKENIRYGSLSATNDEIVQAAKFAQAHKFIDRLPQKYETLVGERGVKLSGGERQRVAIARAFLKKAKILLLDEATSALDSESELMIGKALEKLMRGKTVIAIAHRLSTLRAMDRIVVLDGGQVIEDGSHEDLVKLGGVYAELWAHQAGGFIKEE